MGDKELPHDEPITNKIDVAQRFLFCFKKEALYWAYREWFVYFVSHFLTALLPYVASAHCFT